MREKLQLHIPEPCHEDWNQMTPVEQGSFCTSCQKNVVDFTRKDDEEIFDFFKNYSDNTCGRFSNDQLQRPIEVIKLKRASSFLKYAASLLLPAVLLGNKLSAQKKNVKELDEIVITGYGKRVGKVAFGHSCPLPINEKKDTFQFKELKSVPIEQLLSGKIGCLYLEPNTTIKGFVLDERDSTPLAGTSVYLKDSNKATLADINGKFSLSATNNEGILVFSTVGYVSKEINVSYLKANPNQKILLSPAIMGDVYGIIIVGTPVKKKKNITGGAVVVAGKKVSILDKIRDTLLPPKIKIYPNPVSASGTINISFPNVKAGIYQIRLLSANGQLLYSFQKQISGKNETEQIHLGNHILAGQYLLQVMNEQKKSVQSSRVIVQ